MKKIVVIAGPTASGKTALSVQLAKRFGGEIISADSMQIYRGMPVATAVATPEEQEGVPHHLIEFLEPDEPFSVAEFVKLANEKIDEIICRGHVPFIVGGTGLFIDSLLNNLSFADSGRDPVLREKLSARMEREGCEALYAELLAIDPEGAAALHPNNRGRVIRALELYYSSGITASEQVRRSKAQPPPFEALTVGITYRDRRKLYSRINRRVDCMVQNGLIEEARKNLGKSDGATSRQAIGHKELRPYFESELTLEQVLENLKRETRRYAKRQLTWFRRHGDVHWLYADEMTPDELLESSEALITKFLKG